MISARGMTRAACAAKRIISTAPNEKFGTNIAGTPRSSQRARRTRSSSSLHPVAPITSGTRASSAARATSSVTGYTVQSTMTSSPDAANARRSSPRLNVEASSRSSAAAPAAHATRPSLPSAPATPTRNMRRLDHFLQRRVFQHDHLLADVGEVDREETVAAGARDVDHGTLAPLRVTDLFAGVEIHPDTRPGVLVDRDFAPAPAAGTRPDADAADRFDRGHLFDEARLRMRERV